MGNKVGKASEYFSFLGQKTQQEAANQAKVDVSSEEAKMKGEVGAKKRQQGLTLQNAAAKIDADTKVYSTQREGQGKKEEIKVRTGVKVFENMREANSQLATKKAEWARQSQVTQVQAAKAVGIRDAELQMEVERRNAPRQTEKLKAESKAVDDYEMKVKEANWVLYKKQKEAEADRYAQEQTAQARRTTAEAALFARQQEADAHLYAKAKEAQGLAALAEAHATYVSKLLDAFKGHYPAMRDYLMINGGMYQEIADNNAEAVRGLQPKISVWTSGADKCSDGGAMEEVAGVYRMLPPLFSTVHEQTGMLPPGVDGNP